MTWGLRIIMTLAPPRRGFFHELRPLNLRGASNFLQGLFAQDIGIAFTGVCKVDDLRSDGSFDAVVAVSDPQSNANHFERNA